MVISGRKCPPALEIRTALLPVALFRPRSRDCITTMSFRRRNEPLLAPRAAPQRQPGAHTGPVLRPQPPGQIATPLAGARGPSAGANGAPQPHLRGLPSLAPGPGADPWAQVPGIKPLPITSQPTVSTGLADLDKILAHQGLPLQTSLLVEELGATDFSLVLLRAFAAQGVVHSRVLKTSPASHVVVVGAPPTWVADLPGPYLGLAREQKKAQQAKKSAEVSVANLAERDMKIAWRYGLKPGSPGPSSGPEDTSSPDTYTTAFDVTTRLSPAASGSEVSYVAVGSDFRAMLAQIEHIARAQSGLHKVVRIVVPGLLGPSLWPPQCGLPRYVLPLVHGLRALLADVPGCVLAASLAVDLYPRDSAVTHVVELLFDGAVHLQPFNAEMTALIERAYKNEPAKVQQGLVNVVKVPVLSARGMMMAASGEYAFRNGRRKFEIEPWGIPVDDTEPEKAVDF